MLVTVYDLDKWFENPANVTRLHNSLRNYLPKDYIEDAVNQAYLKANKFLSAHDNFELRKDLGAWLYRIARNAGIDLLKGEYAKSDADVLDGLTGRVPGKKQPPQLATHPTIYGDVGEREIIESVIDALSQLNEKHKQVIILRGDGLAYRDISEHLNVPIGTVMSTLHYARKKMSAIVTKQMQLEALVA